MSLLRRGGRIVTRQAPTGGWNTRDPLDAMSELDAPILTNWVPRPGGIKMRPAFVQRINNSPISDGAGAMMTYSPPGGSDKLFVAYSQDIYDVTSGSSLGSSVYGSGALTAAARMRWSHTMLTSAANSYMFAVNGSDAPVHYDGSSWANPAITGVDETTFKTVTNHKNRLWFTVGTLLAWYLPNNSVAGAATSFDLGPLARRGGHLVNIGTWTKDGGLGPDDYIVFLTSKGEAIVYAGTDPSSTSTWGLVGVFQLAPPVGGPRCMVRIGADLVIMTIRGIIPMSQAMTLAESGLGNIALTAKIGPTFEEATRSHTSYEHWQMIEWPREKLLICNIPTGADSSEQYVMSTETMGWCKWSTEISGKPVSFGVLGENLHFIDSSEDIWDVQTTVASAIDSRAVMLMSFQPIGQGPNKKRITMVRPSILATVNFRPRVRIRTNYDLTIEETSDVTDSGETAAVRKTEWIANHGFGHVFAPYIHWATVRAFITLNTIDIMYEEGGAL